MSEQAIYEPQCLKCGGRHFLAQGCASGNEDCPGCLVKQSRIEDLEREIESGRKRKRDYQREYMKKRRAR